ncbi:hypothetical protein V5799_022582, partial [Amblyomma americanum]
MKKETKKNVMLGQHSMLRLRIALFAFFYIVDSMCSARALNRYIRHYEPLSYEPVTLHRGRSVGGRWKRSVDTQGDIVQVTFKALNRLFRLLLVRDRSWFSDDFVLVTSRGAVNASLDHVYSGHVAERVHINAQKEVETLPQERRVGLKRVCNLEVLVDHTLFEAVLTDMSGEREKALDAITAMVATHTAAATDVFSRTDFGGITGISFEVQRVQ